MAYSAMEVQNEEICDVSLHINGILSSEGHKRSDPAASNK